MVCIHLEAGVFAGAERGVEAAEEDRAAVIGGEHQQRVGAQRGAGSRRHPGHRLVQPHHHRAVLRCGKVFTFGIFVRLCIMSS